MTSLADRLRGMLREQVREPAREPVREFVREPVQAPDVHGEGAHEPRDRADAVADVLGGEWAGAGGGAFLVVDRTCRPGHRHGRLAIVDHLLPEGRQWSDLLLGSPVEPSAGPARPGGGAAAASPRTLFMDLETTGLAGGAGTSAFLIGCAWFDGPLLRIRQYFLANPASERSMLDMLASLAGDTDLVVSYNGKSFDLPLVETRFLYNRMTPPFASTPHLDMLHVARRLWRGEGESGGDAGCRLGTFERSRCGHERVGDVAGFEVPGRYFHFIRTGDPRPLAAVFEHNRLDLVTLACLTSMAARLVEDGVALARTAREAIGLGRMYERAGLASRARGCFARACGLDEQEPLPGGEESLVEGLKSYALICRRLRQHADAAVAWQRLVSLETCPPQVLREATEALAIHHEHRLRDVHGARAIAARSSPLLRTAGHRQALQHRLARLDRKAEQASRIACLF